MGKHRITVDTCDEDMAFVKRFMEQVDQLAGLTVEMMGENRTALLSPYFRAMLAEKAVEVQRQCGRLRDKVYVDNPGDPIT